MSILRRIGIGKERRSNPRLRLPIVVNVAVGRQQAVLIDIGRGGARVHCFASMKRDEKVRFSLRFRDLQLELNALIAGCRVIALKPSTTYELRLQFHEVQSRGEELIDEFIRQVDAVRSRRWTRRKQGYARETATPRRIVASYIQLIRTENGWKETLSFDSAQPDDGVTIPARTTTAEILALCETYDTADEEGRAALRAKSELACTVAEDAGTTEK